MERFQVHGPDPDGDWFIVEVVIKGDVRHETSLDEVFDTQEKANAVAEALNTGAP